MKISKQRYLKIGLIGIGLSLFVSCQKNMNVESSKAKGSQYHLLSASDSTWAASDTNFVPLADAQMITSKITPVVFRGWGKQNNYSEYCIQFGT